LAAILQQRSSHALKVCRPKCEPTLERKCERMDFFRPTSISEALSLLSKHEGARCLAGGATLVAMMNAGLIEPAQLISLADLSELSGISTLNDGSVRVGAMTRHAETSQSRAFRNGQKVLVAAAGKIANVPVRNMGTIGGSLAFADPAADYLPALAALDAVIETASKRGQRALPIAEFIVDWYTTALEPDEMITGVLVPPASKSSVGVFEKLERTGGDYAIASVACILSVSTGVCTEARVAIGACSPGPIRRHAAERLLEGTSLPDDKVGAAGKILADACDPVDDVRGSAEYRRLVVPRLVAKALTAACSEAGGRS
jgi:aerobic carbon-monoxide dehydrogenase medium subunit